MSIFVVMMEKFELESGFKWDEWKSEFFRSPMLIKYVLKMASTLPIKFGFQFSLAAGDRG